jgi:hypothetical protein
MEINSKKINVLAKNSVLFGMLTNCNNIGKYIPTEKINDLQTTENTCSFSVSGAGKIEMTLVEKNPFSTVTFSVGNAAAKDVKILFYINETNEHACELHAEAFLEVPFFMSAMLKNPLQKFMDILMDYIKIEGEKNVTNYA